MYFKQFLLTQFVCFCHTNVENDFLCYLLNTFSRIIYNNNLIIPSLFRLSPHFFVCDGKVLHRSEPIVHNSWCMEVFWRHVQTIPPKYMIINQTKYKFWMMPFFGCCIVFFVFCFFVWLIWSILSSHDCKLCNAFERGLIVVQETWTETETEDCVNMLNCNHSDYYANMQHMEPDLIHKFSDM